MEFKEFNKENNKIFLDAFKQGYQEGFNKATDLILKDLDGFIKNKYKLKGGN